MIVQFHSLRDIIIQPSLVAVVVWPLSNVWPGSGAENVSGPTDILPRILFVILLIIIIIISRWPHSVIPLPVIQPAILKIITGYEKPRAARSCYTAVSGPHKAKVCSSRQDSIIWLNTEKVKETTRCKRIGKERSVCSCTKGIIFARS